MYPRQNPMGISGVDTVVSLAAGLIGVVFGALIGIVLYAVRLPYVIFKSRKDQPSLERELAECEEPLRTARLPKPGVNASATNAVADRVRMLQVDDLAKVHCRFYQERGVIQRHAFFLTEKAIQKLGARIELDPLPLAKSIDLDARTISEIRALCGVESSTDAVKLNIVQGDTLPAESGAGEAAHVAHQSPPKRKPSRPRHGAMAYQGALVGSGVQTRTVGSRTYESYCVTFDDEALGTEHQLWGADLERALKESGALVGDRVRIELVGETPTMVKGKSVTKKIWQVSKVV